MIRLIDEEHKYGDNLTQKAKNKILYLIDKKTDERGIEAEVPYFWYMFGVVTAEGTRRSSGGLSTSKEVKNVTVGDNNCLRSVVRETLEEYYETSLEEITDTTYLHAPYDVQTAWRELDKKIRTHHTEHTDFYDVDPSWVEIRNSVNEVYNAFPTERFTEQESDLLDWYSVMMRELNSPSPDVDRLMKSNISFWRIFSLSVAEEHRHEMSKEEVLNTLEISSFDEERQKSRDDLRQREKEGLKEKFEGEVQNRMPSLNASDAVTASVLSRTLIE
jgi:hypothetical protein